jgi:hypothetical protein
VALAKAVVACKEKKYDDYKKLLANAVDAHNKKMSTIESLEASEA